MALEELLADRSQLGLGIITSISIAVDGDVAAERAGRTPADTPIVLAVGRRLGSGAIRLVLTGVASTPVLVEPEAIGALDPPADFRGSAEYRRQLAAVLAERVLARLGEST
jgi:CO/xanthine dehydrogenase FAD-binding subunit